ncbi:MAG: hypothetical protein CMJ58_11615 [Planctomycetaceae bacterium]|nr:hypothetical protein [Planctomycetaceae bacterium]
MDTDAKRTELAELQRRVAQLESQIALESHPEKFRPKGFYTAYYATTGFMLGMFGAVTSLLFNIVGATFTGKPSLEIVRSYLTFPLGNQAFEMTGAQDNLMLTIGCCLYIGTGMLLGIPVYLALVRWGEGKSLMTKFVIASIVSLAIWIINFYGILSWLQPRITDTDPDNLIVNHVPPYVAAATHLVFGWTMVLVYPLGQYVGYDRVTEQS